MKCMVLLPSIERGGRRGWAYKHAWDTQWDTRPRPGPAIPLHGPRTSMSNNRLGTLGRRRSLPPACTADGMANLFCAELSRIPARAKRNNGLRRAGV